MMTQQNTQEETFYSMLEKLYGDSTDGESLKRLKAKAWERFQEIGLPTRKTEVYKYVRLRSLFSRAFASSHPTRLDASAVEGYVYPECKTSFLVFINGHYRPELSDTSGLNSKIVITHLSAASRTYGTFLNNRWSKELKAETDPFAVLNGALTRDGAFIYVPPGTVAGAPLQIIQLADAEETTMAMIPRIHCFVGAGAEFAILNDHRHRSGSGYCVNEVIDMAVEEGAHVRCYQTAMEYPDDAWVFTALRATLKRDSTLKAVSVTNGSVTVRDDYRVALMGENAEADLNGAWMTGSRHEVHTHVLVDHQQPHCRSNQLFKGVLRDTSRSSFEGKIYVHAEAQKTDAFQLNNNLILSEGAHADSKPNLEIFADDVKASHGSTVGQLDEELLFYMKSRGVSDDTAKNLLIHGYCREVIDLISIPTLAKKLSDYAKSFLK
ncbi:MAG: Fe-S cluster assembly protein SufD [Chlamydiales bacterium]|nr:Fe-S cluster assembly protein SufD [Chlamydiia bacterium]MCP5507933.1 Fe-S cluster assembly protein SufD [Chlamydiales bacterium]